MKHTLSTLLTASALALTLTPGGAHAENLFLLQLGVFSNKENAASQFSEVSANHDDVLGGKRYILRKTKPLSGSDSTSWRVLVGPFDSRKAASSTCSNIKEKGTDCFVVETAAVNIQEFEGANQIAKSEPIVMDDDGSEVSSNETTNESATSANSLLPWNWFSSNESGNTPAPKEEPEETQSADASSSSNININTHSVYKEQPATTVESVSLADAVVDMFDFGDDDTETEANSVSMVDDGDSSKAQPIDPDEEQVKEKAEVQTVEVTEPEDKAPQETPETTSKAETEVEETATERTGEVEVAEAIPVPLLEPDDVPVTPAPEAPKLLDIKLPQPKEEKKDLPEVSKPEVLEPVVKPAMSKPATTMEIANKAENMEQATKPIAKPVAKTPRYPSPVTSSRSSYSASSSRLLQVSIFDNDRDAFKCLNQVQSSVAGSNILRTRIIKSTVGKAVLRFGPVNDAQLEADICDVVSTCSGDLRCRILTEQRPSSARPASRVNTNAKAPKDMTPRSTETESASPAKEPTTTATTSLMNRPVWIQLGTSSSKSDAEDRFESLKKQHPDLVGSYTPTITNPENPTLAGEIYRLRIGPFDQRSDARSLCAKLSSHGVGCLILSK